MSNSFKSDASSHAELLDRLRLALDRFVSDGGTEHSTVRAFCELVGELVRRHSVVLESLQSTSDLQSSTLAKLAAAAAQNAALLLSMKEYVSQCGALVADGAARAAEWSDAVAGFRSRVEANELCVGEIRQRMSQSSDKIEQMEANQAHDSSAARAAFERLDSLSVGVNAHVSRLEDSVKGMLDTHSRLSQTVARLETSFLQLALSGDRSAAVAEGGTGAIVDSSSAQSSGPMADSPTSQNGKLDMLPPFPQSLAVEPTQPAPSTNAQRLGPVYIGNGLLMIRTNRGIDLICDANDTQITPRLVRDGEWEPALTSLYERVLRPGMSYLEIGAHIGYFTTFATNLVGHTGRTHAFEPHPETFKLLKRNIAIQHQSYLCTLEDVAISDEPGPRAFNTFTHNRGSSTLSALPQELISEFQEQPMTAHVRCTSLDVAFSAPTTPFDFIKIDAEGAECSILRGGAAFFADCITPDTTLCLECNPPALAGLGDSVEDVVGLLQRYGFHVWALSDRGEWASVESHLSIPTWRISELIASRSLDFSSKVAGG